MILLHKCHLMGIKEADDFLVMRRIETPRIIIANEDRWNLIVEAFNNIDTIHISVQIKIDKNGIGFIRGQGGKKVTWFQARFYIDILALSDAFNNASKQGISPFLTPTLAMA